MTRWWRERSLRARLTSALALVVALGALGASVLVLTLVRTNLVSGLDDVARQRATDVASLIGSSKLVDPLPSQRQGEGIVQVVDASGKPIAETANIKGEARLFDFAGSPQGVVRRVEGGPLGESASFRVVALDSGGLTIYSAVPLEGVDHVGSELTTIFAVGGPIVVVLLAGIGWVLVGRALRPVAALRQQVAEIPGDAPDRRLALPEAQDEIHRLAGTFNELLGRVDEATSRQREFVADAAHELRSPIASLRTQLEVAHEHPGHVQWPVLAEDLLDDTLRLNQLADNLLLLARLDASPPRQRHAVDLDEIVLEELRRSKGRLGLVSDASMVSAARVWGDKEELTRVVRNLLDNAQRHAVSRVAVALSADETTAILAVSDDGAGIAPEDRDRIFVRFTRLDEARARDAGGAGLGLAIVADVVRAHDGSVTVADHGPGTTFIVRIPLVG